MADLAQEYFKGWRGKVLRCVCSRDHTSLYTLGVYYWVASEHQAGLINKQLGTEYTREDIFFASEYIDEIRELHRKRIEVNGDLFKEGE